LRNNEQTEKADSLVLYEFVLGGLGALGDIRPVET
jgi:hypothetical protein